MKIRYIKRVTILTEPTTSGSFKWMWRASVRRRFWFWHYRAVGQANSPEAGLEEAKAFWADVLRMKHHQVFEKTQLEEETRTIT